jgi:ADP-heptose:LPS heptosyltransferase
MARLVGDAARLRLPGARGSRTLVVRSTSLGDFAVFLPFLATVDSARGAGNVDLLIISRTGDIARALLGPQRTGIAVIDPTNAASLLAGIGGARRTFTGRRYREVLYATQNSDSAGYRLRKLAMLRGVVGFTPPVRGIAAHPAIRSRNQLAEDPGEFATNQALAPYVACDIAPSVTRQDLLRMIAISAEEFDVARRALAPVGGGVDRDSLIALYVNAKDERKRWPLDRYVQVARHLLEDSNARLCLIGGGEDYEVTNQVTSALSCNRVVNLTGRLSVRETIALLGSCGLFIGNDGSPAHFAALAGCRVLALHCNWESSGLWEPIAAPHSLSIRPAPNYQRLTEHGIETISTDLVVRAIGALQERTARHRIWTVAGDGYSERVHALTPFAREEQSDASIDRELFP